MVEENPGRAKHTEAFAIVHCDPVTINLGNAIRRPGIQRSALFLGNFLDLAEHLTRTGLIKSDPLRIEQADGLKHASYTQSREFAGKNRLVPRGGHERLRR